ncbi:MAG: hypothetical protein AUI91_09040 [Acidobacteria bacterium 13_1_40CM_3_56_11]|nr:MAG: hypothetical protein AUI91_09040 [Acidobacteria bacterium 13_1_40CM_3_56_11]
MSRFLNVLSTLVYAFCQFFFSFAALGQQPTVRNITIESDWGGLADSAHLKLFIHGRNGKFYLDEKVIESSRIEALLAALRSEALPIPEASNLGITREWLQQNASTIPEGGAPNQQALFEETFSNPKTIERLLPSLFRFWRFDDYPGMRISVAFANGQRWVAASDSYYPFMLPWAVALNGQKQTKTYNADISRAIAALMPAGGLNRGRLDDMEMKKELADAVMTYVKDQWDLLNVENRAPDSFAILRRNFEVKHARINPYRSVDYGYVGYEPAPHEQNLLATLRKPSLPSHTAEDVVLLFHDGKIEGVGDLAERIAPYEALALSVPWLKRYLADHPEQPLYIRFVHDRSFSAKASKTSQRT